MNVPLIRVERLIKTYRTGEVEVLAVKGVDFTIEAKSFVQKTAALSKK